MTFFFFLFKEKYYFKWGWGKEAGLENLYLLLIPKEAGEVFYFEILFWREKHSTIFLYLLIPSSLLEKIENLLL